MTLSIRKRLTLAYGAALAMALVAAGLALVATHSRLSGARLDNELARLGDTVGTVLQNELGERLAPTPAAEEALTEARAAGRGLVIRQLDGLVLGQRWPPDGPATIAPLAGAADLSTIEIEGVPWRLRVRTDPPVPPGYAVLALAPARELLDDRATVVRAMLIIFPLALLLSVCGGWWIAGRALKPARRMTEEAEAIGEHSAARLTVARHDELGQLAAAFNRLLDRLGQALAARRQFLADASHELRTPVSVARIAADSALSGPPRTADQYRDALEVVLDQLKRLGRIIGDMLLLAREDVERWPLQLTGFYADDLSGECVRALTLLASQRDVRIVLDAEPDLQVTADEELLRQMIANLLENAIVHTPGGQPVHVSVRRDGPQLRVEVGDHGPGVPAADRDRIFERFVRTGSSGGDGLGLGLAIARRIARAHGGEVVVLTSGADGTVFRATIPIEPAPDKR